MFKKYPKKQIRWLWLTPTTHNINEISSSLCLSSVSQILDISELSRQSIRTLPPIPTCKIWFPQHQEWDDFFMKWEGIYLHLLFTYVYVYTYYISYLKMIILSNPENHDFAISTRFTGSPFLVFFGYNNVTYKNKQESSWQNYLGRGYEYPHNHFQERHDMMNPSRLVNRHCQYDSTYLGTNADMFLLVPAPSRLIVMSMMS